MNLHEYQAKQLFRAHNVPTPRSVLATTLDEATAAANELGGSVWVVKAQVHAGGRGKAGGVKVAKNLDEVKSYADGMLGNTLKTFQSGDVALPINSVLIEEGLDIQNELYLSALVDRATRSITFIGSTEGGMDIEEVAHDTPEKLHTVHVDPAAGFLPYVGRRMGYAMGLDKAQTSQLTKVMAGIYDLFQKKDLAMVEINPLIVTGEGNLLALDGKINVDENALYRHPDIADMRDPSQEDEREAIAQEHELNYVALDGDIGCMVNGAGLAMATMDIVQLHGGAPANFLDVGGGATAERVCEAFKLILSSDKVKAIFVNIFGGIVRCDLIAQGIIDAAAQVELTVPVIVRLQGTNSEKGLAMIQESSLNIQAEGNLTDAAKLAVSAAKS